MKKATQISLKGRLKNQRLAFKKSRTSRPTTKCEPRAVRPSGHGPSADGNDPAPRREPLIPRAARSAKLTGLCMIAACLAGLLLLRTLLAMRG